MPYLITNIKMNKIETRIETRQNPSFTILGKVREEICGFLRKKIPETRESSKLELVRTVEEEDIYTILRWASNSEVRRHLDPAPTVPSNWSNPEEISRCSAELWYYYQNKGEPKKIQPLLAADFLGEPLGVLTIRWHGDPYVPVGRRIASIERLIVDPEMWRKGIGTKLMATAIDLAFNEYKGYSHSQGAKSVRAWIMTDKLASPWERNYNLLRRLGFQVVNDEAHWLEYKRRRRIESYDEKRDALWMEVYPQWFRDALLILKEEGIDAKPASLKL